MINIEIFNKENINPLIDSLDLATNNLVALLEPDLEEKGIVLMVLHGHMKKIIDNPIFKSFLKHKNDTST